MDWIPTWVEIKGFIAVLAKHWAAPVAAFIGCASLSAYERYVEAAPMWLIPTVAGMGLLIAAFNIWKATQRDLSKAQTDIIALKNNIQELSDAFARIKKPQFSIRCEEGGLNPTVNHEATIRVATVFLRTGEISEYINNPISLFGFTITNTGIDTAKNCRLDLVRVEKDGSVIMEKTGSLPFEARNLGDDLEVVDLPNKKEQASTVCSIYYDDRLMIGTGNAKWRKGAVDHLFKTHGEYHFFVALSSDGVETQTEEFILTMNGPRKDCHFRHITKP